MQRFELLRRFEQQAFVEHIRNLELLDDLLVFDRHVLLILIEVKQLLPRRRYVLIGGKHSDQRAERELALDDKISADQEKQERRKIADQIVEEFYEEFAVIDLEPNVVDFSQALRDVGELICGGVIGANFGACGDGLGDPVRKHPHLAHPLAPEAANDALHLWNEIALQRK